MTFLITHNQKQKLNKIAKKYGVEFMVLFGSYASNEEKEKSDLDIALMLKENQAIDLFGQIYNEIRKVLQPSFPDKAIELDLRLLNGSDPFFLAQVGKNGQFLAGNEHSFNKFQLYAFRLYLDDVKKLALAVGEVSLRNLQSMGP